MKRTLEIIGSILIFFAVSVAGIGSWQHHFNNPQVPKDAPMFADEVLHLEPVEVEVISEVPLIRTSQYVNLTFEEMDLLEQIAMSEAEGEDIIGKILVMRVVLNRSLRDGKSIEDVIFAPNQFYTRGMKPGDEECHEAIGMVIDGYDPSEGALYFSAGGYSRYGEPLFQHGNHYFSK